MTAVTVEYRKRYKKLTPSVPECGSPFFLYDRCLEERRKGAPVMFEYSQALYRNLFFDLLSIKSRSAIPV